MKPRLLKIPAPVALLLLALVGVAAADAPARRPNVIFILADDLGWGDIGCAGHPYMKTPNIDALAKRGTMFTQFYVANPVCSPSRTAFMTSHYPARHHVDGHFAEHQVNADRGMPDWLDPHVATVTSLFKAAGYATAHFGKWHLGHGPGAPPPARYGIDVSRTVNSSGPVLKGQWTQPHFRNLSTQQIADEAIAFMRAHRDEPFYINFWTLLPHAPLKPTPEQLAVYEGVQFDADHPAFKGPFVKYLKAAQDPQSQMRVYCASVTALDDGIGRLLKGLEELGLSDRTILVFSSDNGPEDYHTGFAENAGTGNPGPHNGRKRSLYEGGIRTPLIVAWPKHVPAGKTNKQTVVAAVDFLPTVCRLAGVEAPASLKPDGEEMSDVWLGADRSRRRPLFWEWLFEVVGDPSYTPPRTAVRDGDFKLLINPDGSRPELYNIPDDPTEQHNLAASRAEVVRRLKQELDAWQATLPWPRGGKAAGQGHPGADAAD